jgi:hypothetical protein
MSSIPFHTGALNNAGADSQYYSAAFDTSASFTMNPLSSHPPRTPRTSLVSSGGGVSAKKEMATEQETVESSEIDEEEDRVKETERRISKEEVWREIILTSYGRDKAFVREYILFLSYPSEAMFVTESYPIFYTRVSAVSRAHCYQQTVENVEADESRS